MRNILLLLSIISCTYNCVAQIAAYIGTIDKYKVIVELNSEDGKVYTGRYHYDRKEQWIDLKGKMKGLVLHLNEISNGKITGLWELVFEDTKATGTWKKNTAAKPLRIKLDFMEDGKDIHPRQPIIQSIAGNYVLARKVDNSKFPKDNKDEVPFGSIYIEQLSDREIRFELDYNSGYPDYHLANIADKAVSLDGGKTYEFQNFISATGSENKCKVIFAVKGKDIYVTGGTGVECGSGANANPEGLYQLKK